MKQAFKKISLREVSSGITNIATCYPGEPISLEEIDFLAANTKLNPVIIDQMYERKSLPGVIESHEDIMNRDWFESYIEGLPEKMRIDPFRKRTVFPRYNSSNKALNSLYGEYEIFASDVQTIACALAIYRHCDDLSLSEDIDALMTCSFNDKYLIPSDVCNIHNLLGLKKEKSDVFSIRSGCSTPVSMLNVASSFIESGRAEHILVSTTCMSGSYCQDLWIDDGLYARYGDGCSSFVVSKVDDGFGNLSFGSYVEGEFYEAIQIVSTPECVHEVNIDRELARVMSPNLFNDIKNSGVIEEVLEQAGMNSKEEIKYFFIHQPNSGIDQLFSNIFEVPVEKIPQSFETYGNVGPASAMTNLYLQIQNGNVQEGDNIMFCVTGVGMNMKFCVAKVPKQLVKSVPKNHSK